MLLRPGRQEHQDHDDESADEGDQGQEVRGPGNPASCSLRQLRASDGKNVARPQTKSAVELASTRPSTLPVPWVRSKWPGVGSQVCIWGIEISPPSTVRKRWTHQYSLREAYPLKWAYFPKKRGTA